MFAHKYPDESDSEEEVEYSCEQPQTAMQFDLNEMLSINLQAPDLPLPLRCCHPQDSLKQFSTIANIEAVTGSMWKCLILMFLTKDFKLCEKSVAMDR